jgi:hypothetical protein
LHWGIAFSFPATVWKDSPFLCETLEEVTILGMLAGGAERRD